MVFWGFLEPTNSLRKAILLHKVRENCHFVNPHPHALTSYKDNLYVLGTIFVTKMVPNKYVRKRQNWKYTLNLLLFFLNNHMTKEKL